MKANDNLQQHTGSGVHYRYLLGMTITEGAKDMADQFECYWLLDVICSYQPKLKGEEFQVWELTKKADGTAVVICTDGNDNILKQQKIPFTDIECDSATLWVEYNTILLPSEH